MPAQLSDRISRLHVRSIQFNCTWNSGRREVRFEFSCHDHDQLLLLKIGEAVKSPNSVKIGHSGEGGNPEISVITVR